MKFIETPLKGAYTLELEKKGDERGFFARFFCCKEFASHDMDSQFVQVNTSFSANKGTLRGFHYQLAPRAESKLVRCIHGSLYDVIIDLRPNSPTFGHSFGAVLSAENRKMMFVPKGFAHAFLTLEAETEALYLVSEFYAQEFERAIRWNDPAFNVQWPIEPTIISDKDRNQPDFNPAYHLADTEALLV